jgi:exodeoxyribonuclease VII small subunit
VTAPQSGEAGSLTGTLRRLEEIVRALEGGESDLDRALALFEEGVALLRVARERVAEAELRVQRVLENASGDLRVTDLDA